MMNAKKLTAMLALVVALVVVASLICTQSAEAGLFGPPKDCLYYGKANFMTMTPCEKCCEKRNELISLSDWMQDDKCVCQPKEQ